MGNDLQVKSASSSSWLGGEQEPMQEPMVDPPRALPLGTGAPVEGRLNFEERVHVDEDVRVSEVASEKIGGEKVNAGLAAEVVGTADYDETLSMPMRPWGLKKMGLQKSDGLLDQQQAA